MWNVEVVQGSARAFHARDLPDPVTRTLWWFEVDTPAIVLGSSQPISDIDAAACDAAGVEVVRRRSGGGAVLLEPGDAVWVDVLLPRDDRLWVDDVGRSAWWLGGAWQRALHSLGMTGTSVHRGRMVTSSWSARVCFAGIGGGEVVLDGHKVVGISQRRTRAGARYQCVVYRRWHPTALTTLLSPPQPTIDVVEPLAAPVPGTMQAIQAALLAALPSD